MPRTLAAMTLPTLAAMTLPTLAASLLLSAGRSSVSLRSPCAPSGPTGKCTTSPSASSRSPSASRSVGRPRRTISSSSCAWWKWKTAKLPGPSL
jgi:hypothetical protein